MRKSIDRLSLGMESEAFAPAAAPATGLVAIEAIALPEPQLDVPSGAANLGDSHLMSSDADGDINGSAVAIFFTTDELQVNPGTPGTHQIYDSAIASLADGDIIIAYTQDYDVYTQRYTGYGTAVGGPVAVRTPGSQYQADVIALTGGGYIVTWTESSSTTGYSIDIIGQIYTSDGQKVGGIIRINNQTVSKQYEAQVTALDNGGFVVAWGDTNSASDGSNSSIKARLFSATGVAAGGEFLVNSSTTGYQETPAVSGLVGGGFVVAWEDSAVEGNYGIRGRIYASNGTPTGAEFHINTAATGDQWDADVATLRNGNFVVTWRDGYANAIKAQIFTASGVAVGSEISVHGSSFYTANLEPAISALDDGTFVITWKHYNQYADLSTDTVIVYRFFSADGTPQSDILAANRNWRSPAETDQRQPVITHTFHGFAVAWLDNTGSDGGDNHDLKLQYVGWTNSAPVFDGHRDAVIVLDNAPFTLSADHLTQGISDPDNDTLYLYGPSVDHGVAVLNADASVTITPDFGYYGPIKLTYGITDLQDDGAIGLTETIQIARPFVAGEQTTVNTIVAGAQSETMVAGLANGGKVVVWTDESGQIGDPSGHAVAMRVYGANGLPLGPDTLVNETTGSHQNDAAVAGLSNGNYVVTWTDYSRVGLDTFVTSIKHRLFDSSGNAVSPEALVNQKTAGGQYAPAVTNLLGGGFVITWQSGSRSSALGDTSSWSIVARVYNNDGPVTNEFLVNKNTLNGQYQPWIANLTGGGFVIAWIDDSHTLGDPSASIKARVYSSEGVAQTTEFLVNTQTLDTQTYPAISRLTGGGFVITWQDATHGDGSGGSVKAQIYTEAGARVGGEFLVNSTYEGNQTHPTVTGLSDGGFLITWLDIPLSAIRAQRFTADGTAYGGEFQISDTVSSGEAVITPLADGGFTVVWTGTQDNADLNIYSRTFSPLNHAPVVHGTPVELPAGAEDQAYNLDMASLVSGYGDSDGHSLTIAGLTVDHGSVADHGNGSFTVTPIADFSGEMTLSYTISDGHGGTLAVSKTLVFNPVNDAPRLTGETTHLPNGLVNTDYSFTAAQLLEGYSDPEGGLLSISFIWADNGTVIDNGDGTYTLKPASHEDVTLIDTDTAYTMLQDSDLHDNGDGTFSLNEPPYGDHHLGYFLYLGDIPTRGTILQVRQIAFSDDFEVDIRIGTETYTVGLASIYSGDEYYTYDTVTVLDNYVGPVTLHYGISDGLPEGEIAVTEVVFISDGINRVTGNDGDNLLTGSDEVDIVSGLGGNDTMNAGLGDDSVFGGAGHDVLDGGAGNDALAGGEGNDSYVVDTNGDVVTEGIGEGIDTVFASVNSTIAANVENLTLTGSAVSGNGNSGNNSLTGNDAANILTGLAGNDLLDGGLGADTMIGGAGNDSIVVDNAGDMVTELGGGGTDQVQALISYVLTGNVERLVLIEAAGNINGTGNTGNNTITGNSGNNALNGRAGADSLYGGAGGDTYSVDDLGDRVFEDNVTGVDLVISAVSYSGAGQYIENITLNGTADTTATGNGVANVLTGNTGNNALNGAGGADTMVGGLGNDTYAVENAGDVVTELTGQGTDVVNASVSYVLAPGVYVEAFNLTGGNAINGMGNSLANTINGNAGANVLDGGTGADTLSGGLGNDTYLLDNPGDIEIENLSEGTDTVRSFLSHTLGANVENLELQGASGITGNGNGLDNRITGNSGNNKLSGFDGNDELDGGVGNDSLTGGIGNDTFVVDAAGDVVAEAVGEGTDTVRAGLSYVLGANVENLELFGVGNINGTGNGLGNSLTGNAGNNSLDGLGGVDILSGGDGDDSYYVDAAGDVVIETNVVGNDTVNASVSYVLGASGRVEVLNLTGVAAINGTGNGYANSLNGNSASNTLDGGAGNDILIGGAGNDTLIGGNQTDIFRFGLGSGVDTVNDLRISQNDTIDIHAYSNGVVNGGGVVISQVGNDAVINLGGGNSITVLNVLAASSGFLSHITW